MPRVKLSHPDKVLFPADGITKADLAAYYEAVAPAMLPHVRRRPLNLWRWNAGIERQRVVQQEIPKGAPAWVHRVEVPRRRRRDGHPRDGRRRRHARWLAQINCITPHVWTSRADRLDRPDRMIFDLDPPDEGADFDHIREGALAMGELLRELGREPYAMTSGSRGIHVVAPLRRTAVHDVVRERAREIAEELAARHPERLTTAWRKAKREGRILIDTARNTYAQTTVAPYAVRASPARRSRRRCAGRSSRTARLRADAFTLADAAGAARARRRPVGGDRARVGSSQDTAMFRRRRPRTPSRNRRRTSRSASGPSCWTSPMTPRQRRARGPRAGLAGAAGDRRRGGDLAGRRRGGARRHQPPRAARASWRRAAGR